MTESESQSPDAPSSKETEPTDEELQTWQQVHATLVKAVQAARNAVEAQKAQRRYWLEEICSNLTEDGRLTNTSVWKHSAGSASGGGGRRGGRQGSVASKRGGTTPSGGTKRKKKEASPDTTGDDKSPPAKKPRKPKPKQPKSANSEVEEGESAAEDTNETPDEVKIKKKKEKEHSSLPAKKKIKLKVSKKRVEAAAKASATEADSTSPKEGTKLPGGSPTDSGDEEEPGRESPESASRESFLPSETSHNGSKSSVEEQRAAPSPPPTNPPYHPSASSSYAPPPHSGYRGHHPHPHHQHHHHPHAPPPHPPHHPHGAAWGQHPAAASNLQMMAAVAFGASQAGYPPMPPGAPAPAYPGHYYGHPPPRTARPSAPHEPRGSRTYSSIQDVGSDDDSDPETF